MKLLKNKRNVELFKLYTTFSNSCAVHRFKLVTVRTNIYILHSYQHQQIYSVRRMMLTKSESMIGTSAQKVC